MRLIYAGHPFIIVIIPPFVLMAACPTKGQLSFLAKNRGNDEDYEGDVGDDDVHGDV